MNYAISQLMVALDLAAEMVTNPFFWIVAYLVGCAAFVALVVRSSKRAWEKSIYR